MPNKVKRYFAKNNITVYTINATKIAQEIGLGNRTNTILQSAFFRITEVIPVELAVEKMKAAALKSYGAKGQDVVDLNYAAIDRGGEYKQFTVKPEWANLPDDEPKADNAPAFVKELVRPINAQAGDLLKVSDFTKNGTADGSWMVGTAAYEKRGVEAFVPAWNKDNCIQCNQCAYICPHAAIRPFVLTDDELKGFDNLDTIEMKAAALKSYGAKGQDVVDLNYAAIDRGGEYKQFTVKPEWANLPDDAEKQDDAPAFVKELVRPINAQAGDLLKVSDFVKHNTVDGTWQNGTAAYGKTPWRFVVPNR